ncbi:dUTP diphosphatase, partial [Teratosphaeria destructans]
MTLLLPVLNPTHRMLTTRPTVLSTPNLNMSEETATPAAKISHDAPSLPASPPPKRTKYTDPAPNLSVASILNDHAPTPTPSTMNNNTTTTPLPPHQTLPPMSFEPPPPALQIQLLSPTAKPPTRGSAFAAGY